jgi:hypothetical protein
MFSRGVFYICGMNKCQCADFVQCLSGFCEHPDGAGAWFVLGWMAFVLPAKLFSRIMCDRYSAELMRLF